MSRDYLRNGLKRSHYAYAIALALAIFEDSQPRFERYPT